MAAPHVAGAAALWLASRPGATPAQAKAALLKATTLDWRWSTDPDGTPDPLLDVSRLVAAGDYNVESGRPSGWVNAKGATKSVALKVIRAEDFADAVTLTPVADAPLTATVPDPVNSPGDAVTSLVITVPAKTPSGSYKVTVVAGDGDRERTVTVRVEVDSAGPTAAVPTISPIAGRTFGTTTYAARGRWVAATDNATGVNAYQASWRIDGGDWTTPVEVSTARRYTDRTFRTSRAYELRVRARDGAGNWGPWSATTPYTSGVVQDTGTSLTKAGTWGTSFVREWSKGSALYSRTKGATVSRTFTGRAVAWVAATGPSRGSARVTIDGVLVATISLHARTTSYRKVVFARSWLTSGQRTISITVVGTKDHPRVDLDAIVVVR
jgi:hypothetical protein